jgi:hypothetical protein
MAVCPSRGWKPAELAASAPCAPKVSATAALKALKQAPWVRAHVAIEQYDRARSIFVFSIALSVNRQSPGAHSVDQSMHSAQNGLFGARLTVSEEIANQG